MYLFHSQKKILDAPSPPPHGSSAWRHRWVPFAWRNFIPPSFHPLPLLQNGPKDTPISGVSYIRHRKKQKRVGGRRCQKLVNVGLTALGTKINECLLPMLVGHIWPQVFWIVHLLCRPNRYQTFVFSCF